MAKKKTPAIRTESGRVLGSPAKGGGVVGGRMSGGEPVSKAQHFANLGYGSTRPPESHPGQGSFDLGDSPGVAAAEHKPLRAWTDLHPDKQAKVAEHLKTKYGVTMESAIEAHGKLIDGAFDRARDQDHAAHGTAGAGGGTVHMQGQDFYSGGEQSDRHQVANLAREYGVPFHVAAGVRAAVSPRIKLPGERKSARAVFDHVMVHGKTPDDHIEGAGIQGNARSGAHILHQYLKHGIHPTDAMEPSYGRSGESAGKPRTDKKTGEPIMKKALSGPKVEGYFQSYTHPHHEATRGAMDIHAVAGMTPHLPPNPGKWVDPKDGVSRMIPQNHPDWKPNAEDLMKNVEGATEFFDHASRTAAARRGLSQPEGQAGAWFQQRGVVRGITDAPKEKNPPVQKPLLFNDRRQT